jgi:hypothetical protein
MEQMKKHEESEIKATNKRSFLRKIALAVLGLFGFIAVSFITAIAYNNIALWSDEAFSLRLDSAIKNAEGWVEKHRSDILEVRNAPLIMMLRECNDIKANQAFGGIVTSFLNRPTTHPSRCMKREVDPNWPIIESELNLTISREILDYKWILYSVAPDKAKVSPEELGLFDPERWHRRQLTHQLLALTMFRNRQGSNDRLDKLIVELCERSKTDMTFCLPVVDIYIQRAAFVLRAGFPQKVRRRWIERIIAEQQSDGGWNDRWLCFTTPRRQLVFDIDETPSDQHATVQAVLALYLVKYRYPEQFGLK